MQHNQTDFFINLDEWDKLIIISGAGLFLLLVLVCLVCMLNPLCCMYDCCFIDSDKKEKQHSQTDYGTLYDPNQFIEKKSLQGSLWHPIIPLRETEVSDWSNTCAADIIEIKQDSVHRHGKLSCSSDHSGGTQPFTSEVLSEIRLSYGITVNGASDKLLIRVLQLGNLWVTKPGGVTAPYVKVRVYRVSKHFSPFKHKSMKELRRNRLISESQTKIHRRADNPIFNEMFSIDIHEREARACVVKFLLYDFDRFSRHLVIGEVISDLSNVALLSGDEALFSDPLMTPLEVSLGEVHVALMYLPTAEKLNITILDTKGLVTQEGLKRNTEIYIKMMFMFDGRPVKKAKTRTRGGEANPVFNESFVFDVPAYQLDKVYFILAAFEVQKNRADVRFLLGRMYIGVSFDESSKAQWLEMVRSARKHVACWHKLHD